MPIQELVEKKVKVHIYIPSIIRYQQPIDLAVNEIPGSVPFSIESPLESLKNQLLSMKPELGLKPDKSGFTRIYSVDDEYPESSKLENTRAHFTLEEAMPYSLNLQRMIEMLEKADNQTEKQQKQFAFNTKNILRNICNAQNQFILFNASAQQIIESHLRDSSKFKAWVNKLRFHTFEQFQKVWNGSKRALFTKLYKKLCRKFYIENAAPYIMNSRIKNNQTKLAHVRYLYRFLEGLEEPDNFFYFKQKDK